MTKLVSISHVLWTTGLVMPVARIAAEQGASFSQERYRVVEMLVLFCDADVIVLAGAAAVVGAAAVLALDR